MRSRKRRAVLVAATFVAPAFASIAIAACGSSSSGDDSSISPDSGSGGDSTVIDARPKLPSEAGVDAAPKKYCAADSFIFDAGPDADGGPPATPQMFDSVMAGCAGTVYFADRATLCAANCRSCTVVDWITRHGSTLPTSDYWTNDDIGFSGFTFGNGMSCGASPYGPDGSAGPDDNPGLCFPFSFADGGPGQKPMHVCAEDPNNLYAVDQADRFGNTCTWVRCAYTLDGSVPPAPPLTPDGQAPPPYDSMGGCSGARDNTAGSLCCCE